MSNVHKNQTISFRPSPYERKEIEARIKASGLPKKIFYTRSCLYEPYLCCREKGDDPSFS